MNTKEKYTIEIIDMGIEGEGIGKAEGVAIFVPGAITGDLVEVEITSVKKNFARADVIEVVKPSSSRTKPFCKVADQCGGCTLQAMSYEAQLKLKKKIVMDKLTRIGGISDPKVNNVMGMKEPMRYRNKAQFPISAGPTIKGTDGRFMNEQAASIGFYKAASHTIVNCDTCGLQTEAAEAVAEVLRRFIKADKLSVYDKISGNGFLRHLIVKTAFHTGEVMVILVCNGEGVSNRDKLVSMLQKAIDEIETKTKSGLKYTLRSVILNVNRKKTSEILGQNCITLFGQPVITDQIGEMKFEISPLSFYQTNPFQMKRLYNLVLEYSHLTGEETVLDLYCGVGTIGLYCAGRAKKVIGIESVKSAVIDANRNAVINGIVNAEFVHGKAEIELPKLLEQGTEVDLILLDPPRAGCEKELLTAILDAAPKRIIYVSCDPATLARDLKQLTAGGYSLIEAQPVDMFPWTMHVEVCCHLVKK